MLLQRRHYKLIAEALSQGLGQKIFETEQALEIVKAFRANLAGTNPLFNGEKFERACLKNFRPKNPKLNLDSLR